MAGGAHTGLQVDPSLISGVMTSFMRRQQSELSTLSHSQLLDRALELQRDDRVNAAHRAARNVNSLRAQHLSAGAVQTLQKQLLEDDDAGCLPAPSENKEGRMALRGTRASLD
uniref:Uncharacterized protein n=1 Tax=Prymnesium polylepis TaxID=72548 RepID=A0A7S4NG35_9EUKA